MRHQKDQKKLGRSSAHRRALWRGLATALFREGRIRTTETKAKELRRVADRLVTLAKRAARYQDPDEKKVAARRLHLRRQALSFIRDRAVVAKLFDEVAGKYAGRDGGYTRFYRIGPRLGDGAPMAVVEFVEEAVPEKGKKKRGAKKAATKKAPAKGERKPVAKKKSQEPAPAAEAPAEPSAAGGAEEKKGE